MIKMEGEICHSDYLVDRGVCHRDYHVVPSGLAGYVTVTIWTGPRPAQPGVCHCDYCSVVQVHDRKKGETCHRDCPVNHVVCHCDYYAVP